MVPGACYTEQDESKTRALSRTSSVMSQHAFSQDKPFGPGGKQKHAGQGDAVSVDNLSPAQFLEHTVDNSLTIMDQ